MMCPLSFCGDTYHSMNVTLVAPKSPLSEVLLVGLESPLFSEGSLCSRVLAHPSRAPEFGEYLCILGAGMSPDVQKPPTEADRMKEVVRDRERNKKV